MTSKLPDHGDATEDSTESPGVDRRQFLKVLGVAGAGTAALSGCSTDRVQKLVPYLVQSEQQVPGVPTYYASTCTECSTGCGLHVKTREARPIKLDGNPDHPINAGGLCAIGQAGLQALYNPDRLDGPMARNATGGFDKITWDDAIARLTAQVGKAQRKVAAINGYGPSTFSTLLENWVKALGGKTVSWEAYAREPERKANMKTWGRDDLPVYEFAAAKYIISFGADFLESWGVMPSQQRGFAASHGFNDGGMARHVFVGPRLGLTGANADQWLNVGAGDEVLVALSVAHVVAEKKGHAFSAHLGAFEPEEVAKKTGLAAKDIREIAEAFAAASPSLAVAGGIPAQHRGAIDLCHAVNLINEIAGNVGTTVKFGGAPAVTGGYNAVQDLFAGIAKGDFSVVLVHDANPIYVLPKSGKFAESYAKAFKVSTANTMDETAAASDLILPNLHALERWDDLRPQSGINGLLQPVIEPVFKGMHTGDLLLAVAAKVGGPLAALVPAVPPKAPPATFEVVLQDAWKKQLGEKGFEEAWIAALAKGGVYTATTPAKVTLAATASQITAAAPKFDGDGGYTFLPYVSMMYNDGRGANKQWLLENPDPMTKMTWQSWVEMHPDTAAKEDLRDGEIVEITSPHGTIKTSVYTFYGVRPDTLAMPMGLGHTAYGRWAKDRGVNALDLLGAEDGQGFLPYVSTKVSIKRTGGFRKLARTDGNPRQLGRHIIEAMPVALAAKGMTPEEAYKSIGQEVEETNTEREQEALAGWSARQKERTQYGDYANPHPKWGLAVDLSRCTGCSACVTACYAENNIPTVGQHRNEDDIYRGREMSWLRIERYWEGGNDGTPFGARFAPMMCQHCDNAPCEPVCPVYAAYHTADGLNGQVYNRCVGTRYCSNNCPYKVRYFNWLKYNDTAWPEPLNLQLNPEVTVRARGVMEKCTFCIQRIRGAQHTARLEDRDVRDGEIVTACQQACLSGAITFGNVNDPDSAVVKKKKDPRGYHVLEDLNVRSSVTYLAKVLHQPAVGMAEGAKGEGH